MNHRPEAPPTTTIYNRLTSKQSANVGLAGEGINTGEIQLLRNVLKPQAGPELGVCCGSKKVAGRHVGFLRRNFVLFVCLLSDWKWLFCLRRDS